MQGRWSAAARLYPQDREDAKFLALASVAAVEGVIFYLEENDGTLGWDYPAQKKLLDDLADRLAVAIPDQLHNVMAPTWHRGSQWSVDHLTQYQAEVQERIGSGYAICEDERARLIWINNGLWHDTSFYRSFEEKYGAVFVWSMYTNFFADDVVAAVAPSVQRYLTRAAASPSARRR